MRFLLKWMLLLFAFAYTIDSGSASVAMTLSIGRATDKVTREYDRLNPIVDYLATRLRKDGITGGRVVLEGDNDDQGIIDFLEAGDLDLILESPTSAALYQTRCGAEPILLVRRESVLYYRSIIFSRADSDIHTLEDLRGRIIAFEDLTSTSSYHLPKNSLARLGYRLVLAADCKTVPSDGIGYVFAGSELNVSSWVFYSRVSAGAMSSADWINPEENPKAFRETFRILHQTEAIPRMVVLARKGLPAELVGKIRRELLIMHQIPEGREALGPYRIDCFEALTPAAKAILTALADGLKDGG